MLDLSRHKSDRDRAKIEVVYRAMNLMIGFWAML